ncbi:unnamed protein product [Rhizophagus irregularis]|nr:unnamed protein product [Rhizophagus irregularis]CAB5390101.1 unnamed protein product [Rhizophagus irregularis]
MPLHNKLMEQHLSKVPNHHKHSEYYLINIKAGECTCFDYIWNGPFRDTCLAIFKSHSRLNENNNDPFRPVELNNYKSNNGAPPKSSKTK